MIHVNVVPGTLLCNRVSPHIRVNGVLSDKVNMSLIKNKHLRRQQEYSVVIYFFVAIKSPAKAFKMQEKGQQDKERPFQTISIVGVSWSFFSEKLSSST